MYEPKEIINMLATFAFFAYFYMFFRNGKTKHIPKIWFYGIFLFVIIHTASVVEGFYLQKLFNLVEHFTYFLASICFLVGAVQFQPEKYNDLL